MASPIKQGLETKASSPFQSSKYPLLQPSARQSLSYSALPPRHIRLLHIDLDVETLSGTLTEICLEGEHRFDALSYAWGEAGQMHDFICCGKVLRIRDNLYRFLQRAKEQVRTSRRPIWIDAVCIDQSNDAEKSVQIPLMSEVYKQAQQVLVWLGDCTEAEGNAFLAIKPITRILETNPTAPRLTHNDDGLASLGLPPSSSPIWRNIWKILARPWFTRLWVMQEAALA